MGNHEKLIKLVVVRITVILAPPIYAIGFCPHITPSRTSNTNNNMKVVIGNQSDYTGKKWEGDGNRNKRVKTKSFRMNKTHMRGSL